MNVFGLTEYVTTFVLGAVLLLALYLYGRRPYSYFKELGIPGPEPICYLGNLKEIGKRGNGYAYKHFREIYGNLYGLFFGRLPICVTSDPEFIQEILVKQFSNFTNRTVLFGDEISQLTLPLTKDDHWKYLRTVLTPTFTSHQMRRMNTMIQTYANILVEKFGNLADNGEIREVKTLFSAYTIDVIAAAGFGIIVNSQKNPHDPLVKKAIDLFKLGLTGIYIFIAVLFPSTTILLAKLNLLNSVFGNEVLFRKLWKQLIDDRKKTQMNNDMQKNLLNLMIKAQLKGHETLSLEVEKDLQLENITDWRTKRGITDDEILAQCVVLFLSGYETTASALSFFTYLMAINSKSQQRLYEEIVDSLGEDLPTYDNIQQLPYLSMCFDETMRMYPILNTAVRQCKKTCTVKGTKIPEGLSVRISIDALHYDPKYWPEPDKFIPERFTEEAKSQQVPFSYLPFGAGPRACLGRRLAKLEFKIAAVQMIRNFKILPTEKTENPLMFSDHFLLDAKNGVWVKFERRC
ncbi:cytochrome P450 3A15-like [Octopus sinensis]|uniref:Cytochrome P450 3A15-like n=1 Tax=Octopus sinensis TaxID=2607531 RepID=A0A7E6EHM1_9MOLL|nr:cytochrome P450 3A15-like [Octopus sinensis]